jgi:hypothetical protein
MSDLPDAARDGYSWFNAKLDAAGFVMASREDQFRRVELALLEHRAVADCDGNQVCDTCNRRHPCDTWALLVTGEPA